MKPTLSNNDWVTFKCDLCSDMLEEIGMDNLTTGRDGHEMYTDDAQDQFDIFYSLLETHMQYYFTQGE